jgi:hypothetical protein
MRFHAKHVSAAEAGDYCQVLFQAEDPGDIATNSPPGLDSPYVLIQRQFETPDDGCYYIETRDHGYIGHYQLRLMDFGSTHLAGTRTMTAAPPPRPRQSLRRRAEKCRNPGHGCESGADGRRTPETSFGLWSRFRPL